MPKTVNLTWNNASSGITEQLVERSVTDGAFVQIGTTPPDQNSFIDNVDEFVDETKLSYKVSSNYIHEGTAYSASSSIFDIVINQSPASNEMTFSTTNGSLSYKGIPGDVITLSDGTTYTVLGDGGYSNENVPAGKHKVVLAKTRSHGRVSIGGAALTELHTFPTLSTVTDFNFYPNTPSPNLVKVPAVLPSNITSLNQMFSGATSFNQDISMWDTSNVTSMSGMFYNCVNFNQSLNNWNVGNVTSMSSMFYGCSVFNQPLNDWNTTNLTDMYNMFWLCIAFNQPLDNWDTSSVTTMRGMFSNCTLFNQSLNSWNTSSVTSMTDMFRNCTNFNQNINSWDTSKVTIMNFMFLGCSSFDQPLDNWNVSSVIAMTSMFNGCTMFNQPLNTWNTGKVIGMNSMFYNCTNFNQDISSWCVPLIVSKPTNFSTGTNLPLAYEPVWGTCPRGENVA